MDWSPADAVLSEMRRPRGYHLERLLRTDVQRLIASLKTWYPEIEVGAESCHLDPSFYDAEAALGGEGVDRPILPVVAKHGDDIVALVTYERNEHARTIRSRIGVIAENHRGSGLVMLGPMLLEKLGVAVGAELAYFVATLRSQHQQVLAERMAFDLVGIMPAFDRTMLRGGEIKRTYEALYAKVLASPEKVMIPDPDALTPRTRVVFNLLFGRENPRHRDT